MKNKWTNADRNAFLLTLFSICHGAIFMMPVLLPYYKEQIGLEFWHLMAGETLFAMVVIASEIPTGWLADHWKRKYCLALAGVINFAGWGFLAVSDGFVDTLVAQAILGLGISMVSGTQSALHYDSLLAEGRNDEYRRQEGRRHGMALLSIGLASLSGGFLYMLHADLPIMLTMLVSGLCMFVIAMLMVEPERHRAATGINPLRAMAETLRYALHGHREIAAIVLTSAVLFSTSKMMLWAQMPYYAAVGFSPAWLGVLMACGFLMGSLAGHLGHLLDDKLGDRQVFLIMIGTEIAVLSVSALLQNAFGAIILLYGSLLWGMGWPRVQSAINKHAGSHHRASVLSTASMMIHLLFIPAGLMFGWVSDHFGLRLAIAGLMVLPVLTWVVLLNGARKARLEAAPA